MIEAVFYFEMLGQTRLKVEDRLKKTVENLGNIVKVRRLEIGDVIEDEEMDPLRFSAFVEAEVEGSLEDLLVAALIYGPSIVEVLRPGRLEFSAEELEGLTSSLVSKVSSLNFVPRLPDVRDVPTPPVGLDEEEIWELVYQDRNVLYNLSLSFKVAGDVPSDAGLIKDTVSRVFLLEGARIGYVSLEETNERILVTAELLSPVESLFSIAMRYLPSRVRVEEPDVVDITASELQNILSDAGSFSNVLIMGEDLQKAYEKDLFSFRLGER